MAEVEKADLADAKNDLSLSNIESTEVKIPDRTLTDISMLGTEELHKELEKGYADMKAGRIKDAKTVFSDIRPQRECPRLHCAYQENPV